MEAFWNAVASVWDNSLVKAGVYLLLAFAVAFIVSFIVKRLCKLLRINEKLGSVEDGEGKHNTALGFIGKLTYLIVFLLFLPTVLGHLGLGEVSDSIAGFTGGLIEFIPRLIVAIIILAVGIFAAGILEAVLRAALTKVKLDNLAARIMPCGKMKLSLVSLLSVDCISVSRIDHPRARLYVGMELRVAVKMIDTAHSRLYVTLRELLGTWEQNVARFAVGETVMVDIAKAHDLCDEARGELDMLFSFEHMGCDDIGLKWFKTRLSPQKLMKTLDKWQRELHWNAWYFENHDQPRFVSRFPGGESHRAACSKMRSF